MVMVEVIVGVIIGVLMIKKMIYWDLNPNRLV